MGVGVVGLLRVWAVVRVSGLCCGCLGCCLVCVFCGVVFWSFGVVFVGVLVVGVRGFWLLVRVSRSALRISAVQSMAPAVDSVRRRRGEDALRTRGVRRVLSAMAVSLGFRAIG